MCAIANVSLHHSPLFVLFASTRSHNTMQLLNKKCNGAPVAARAGRTQRVSARVVRVQAAAAAETATKLKTTRSDEVRPGTQQQTAMGNRSPHCVNVMLIWYIVAETSSEQQQRDCYSLLVQELQQQHMHVVGWDISCRHNCRGNTGGAAS
jgi:hypothetical protein